jgi:hypothetical protein
VTEDTRQPRRSQAPRNLPIGVYARPRSSFYRAILSINGRQRYIGNFASVDEAAAAVAAARARIGRP